MSLLDEWETGGQPYGDVRHELDPVLSDEGSDTELASPKASAPHVIFSVETVERHLARGRGAVTAMAVASDIIVVVTSRAWLLRYDLSQGTAPILEVELSKAAGARAKRVWMDAEAHHMVVCVALGGGPSGPPPSQETHYLHARWKKSRVISKLKNLDLSCLAWDPTHTSEASTGEVVVGSEKGTVHTFTVEERDKKEGAVKLVYDMSERREAVRGAAQQPLARARTLLLLSTPTRLFVFVGSGTASEVLSTYPPEPADLTSFLEGGEGGSGGELYLHTAPGADKADTLAWYRGGAVQLASLALDLASPPDSNLDYLTQMEIVPLPTGLASSETPPALAMTQYHVLVLAGGRIAVFNQISGSLVQEIRLAPRLGPGPASQALGLATDDMAGATFCYTGDAVHEVVARDEARDMWHVYLERGRFIEAFRCCSNQAQRDAVSVAEAQAAYQAGDLLRAAGLYGRVASPSPSFQELALKFVEAAAPDALQAFLLARLTSLPPHDKAQATMVATWLTELYLDQINRALLEERHTEAPPGAATPTPGGRAQGAGAGAGAGGGGGGSAAGGGEEGEEEPSRLDQLVGQLRSFMKRHCESLDPNVTVSLLASYGRLDDLMHYAQLRQDHEAVLEYLTQRGDAAGALAVLRAPGVSHQLFYKFAPALIPLDPHATVEGWIGLQPPLEPRRLVPALLRCGEAGAPPLMRQEAIRYVDFCIRHLASTDPAIHNLAVSLYSGEEDDAALLAHLASARDPLGVPLYDPQYALRLARQWGRRRASIALFCELGMLEDAVKLALTVDLDTAAAVAARPLEDEPLQRKLWLIMARHLISTADAEGGNPAASIGRVNEFLKQAGGLVKIEDILPLFPDFVQIDNFKEAICESLEEYNAQIERLKMEMADATRIADALRKDMALLERRQATLDASEPCAKCGRAVGAPPAKPSAMPGGVEMARFYLFPTGNAFHGVCLLEEVRETAPAPQAARINSLLLQLSQGAHEGTKGSGGGSSSRAQLLASLEEEIGVEDPYCGESVIRQIHSPFIEASEQDAIRSWQV
eukprot:jgi/Botrbrau1/11480/Bobra.0360s0007.1